MSECLGCIHNREWLEYLPLHGRSEKRSGCALEVHAHYSLRGCDRWEERTGRPHGVRDSYVATVVELGGQKHFVNNSRHSLMDRAGCQTWCRLTVDDDMKACETHCPQDMDGGVAVRYCDCCWESWRKYGWHCEPLGENPQGRAEYARKETDFDRALRRTAQFLRSEGVRKPR